jgi:hypothetical protein
MYFSNSPLFGSFSILKLNKPNVFLASCSWYATVTIYNFLLVILGISLYLIGVPNIFSPAVPFVVQFRVLTSHRASSVSMSNSNVFPQLRTLGFSSLTL